MDGIQQCSVSASGLEAENGSSKDDSELDDVAIKQAPYPSTPSQGWSVEAGLGSAQTTCLGFD